MKSILLAIVILVQAVKLQAISDSGGEEFQHDVIYIASDGNGGEALYINNLDRNEKKILVDLPNKIIRNYIRLPNNNIALLVEENGTLEEPATEYSIYLFKEDKTLIKCYTFQDTLIYGKYLSANKQGTELFFANNSTACFYSINLQSLEVEEHRLKLKQHRIVPEGSAEFNFISGVVLSPDDKYFAVELTGQAEVRCILIIDANYKKIHSFFDVGKFSWDFEKEILYSLGTIAYSDGKFERFNTKLRKMDVLIKLEQLKNIEEPIGKHDPIDSFALSKSNNDIYFTFRKNLYGCSKLGNQIRKIMELPKKYDCWSDLQFSRDEKFLLIAINAIMPRYKTGYRMTFKGVLIIDLEGKQTFEYDLKTPIREIRFYRRD